MIRALYTAASGMVAQELNLDNIANNLANSSTVGFRSRRLQFEDLIYQNLIMPGAAASQQTTVVAGLQVGLGTRSAASEVIAVARRFHPDRKPAGPHDSGRGIFPGAAAGRANCLHPRRKFSSRRAGQSGDAGWKPGAALDHDSSRRDVGDRGPGRNRERDSAGPNRGAAGGNAAAGSVQQSRRSEQHGQQSFSGDDRVRRSHHRTARGQRRIGDDCAGDARAIECQCGR